MNGDSEKKIRRAEGLITTANEDGSQESFPVEHKERQFENRARIRNADTHGKTLEELRRISEIRDNLLTSAEPNLSKGQEIEQNPHETETISGVEYFVEYVPKEDIYPAYGYSSGKYAVVRQDLSLRVKRFVKAHELYHCADKAVWGGWIGSEIRASLMPGLKNPIGLIATILKTTTDIDRIKFYLRRIMQNH